MLSNDRRLQERELRKQPDSKPINAADLPDLSENAEFPSDESVVELAAQLESEKVTRDLRIEKSIAEPPPAETPIAPPAVPFDGE